MVEKKGRNFRLERYLQVGVAGQGPRNQVKDLPQSVRTHSLHAVEVVHRDVGEGVGEARNDEKLSYL